MGVEIGVGVGVGVATGVEVGMDSGGSFRHPESIATEAITTMAIKPIMLFSYFFIRFVLSHPSQKICYC